jgi:uncharacterized protein YjbI with pentapeptide repeats
MRFKRRIRRLSWFLVFLLGAITAVGGLLLVRAASGPTDVRREIGASLIGSSVIGLVFAVAGQIVESQNRRRTFVAALSEKQDLHGIDLRGADLSGLYLVGKDLTRANLAGADLTGANLAAANLRQANLVGARLDLAVLADADLSGAYLVNSRLRGTMCPGARFEHAVLYLARFEATVLRDARLVNVSLLGARFSSARLLPRAAAWRAYLRLTVNPVAIWKTRRQVALAEAMGGGRQSMGQLRRDLWTAGAARRSPELHGAAMTRVDVRMADLREAPLETLAVLNDVTWDAGTRWPTGFTPPPPYEGEPPKPVLFWEQLPGVITTSPRGFGAEPAEAGRATEPDQLEEPRRRR